MAKTQASFYTIASHAIATVVAGSAFSVPADALRADIRIDFAQVTVTAPLSGTRLIIQSSDVGSANSSWVDLVSILTPITAAVTDAVSGTASATATTITTTGSATFGARSKLLFFKNGTLANSEWSLQTSHVTTTITLPEGITNAQTSSNIYDQAFRYLFQLDVSAISRLRLVVDNNFQTGGPTVVVQSSIMTY